MEHKDNRFKLLSEILAGIKILKLYAWEESFKDKLLDFRKKELSQIKRINLINAVGALCWLMASYLVIILHLRLFHFRSLGDNFFLGGGCFGSAK